MAKKPATKLPKLPPVPKGNKPAAPPQTVNYNAPITHKSRRQP